MSSYKAPGRLGDSSLELKTDPRTNTRLLAALKAFGLDGKAPTPDVQVTASNEEIAALMGAGEQAFEALYEALPNELPSDKDEPEIEHTIETIKGIDDNDIKLHIHRQKRLTGQKLPCVVYIHGGGMTLLKTANKVHQRWTRSLAAAGAVGIAIDFRNAYIDGQHNPFPKGLNDVVAGVKWIAAHKAELGIDRIVLQGESGGGNLSCAAALKANNEGWINQIDGVYALCPFISGGYDWSQERKLKEIPSAIENAGYLLDPHNSALTKKYYSPNDGENPLAWPYHATPEQLKGLPPHVLNMDELDFLRDEGIAYSRKLEAAGVPVVASVNLGVTHAASLIFRQALPDLHNTTINNIVTFAKSLKPPAARL
ncbi:carboxylesterase nlhh [Acrodontium crateriforme]|uniref:Carboxylesterase nlhh n=1 Tax=Acrodontium crateriforme TaxID=150365 RepID=A0AAQ3M4D7_9PEZI|nr:carboxylesterase nlhh [Acrodontium crateriforme]